MNFVINNPLSKSAALVLIGVIVYLNIINVSPNILTWDVFGYYLYLPFTFIYKDITFSDISIVNEIVEQYSSTGTLYQLTNSPGGGWVLKYSMGLAILNAPFFFIGHIVAVSSDYLADGFSLPYQYSIWIGGMLYTLLGILVLRKVLLSFFNDKICTFVLIIIVLGTNYLYNVSYWGQNVNIQNYGFTLYSLIIWCTILWHRSYKFKYTIYLSIVCGLTILSRPTEIVCLIIPFAWGISDRQSLNEKIELLIKLKKQIIAFVLVILIIGLLQFSYWKLSSGKFIFYSYGSSAGEGMDFLTPHFFNVLFSFRKGWLVYTPMMFLSLLGLVYLFRNKRHIFWPVFIYFIVNLYLVSCWSTWWYAQCFGQRALIPSYVILSIPLGYSLIEIRRLKNYYFFPVLFLIIALLGLNLFQTWQYADGVLSGSRMSKEYYFRIFAKTHAYEADRKLMLVSRQEWPIENVPIDRDYSKSKLHFDNLRTENSQSADLESHFRLDTSHRFTPAYSIKFKDFTRYDHAYLRATFDVFIPGDHIGDLPVIVMTFKNRRGLYKYNSRRFEADSVIYDSWNTITMDYLTPEVRSRNDEFQVYLWYRGSSHTYVRNLIVESFNPMR